MEKFVVRLETAKGDVFFVNGNMFVFEKEEAETFSQGAAWIIRDYFAARIPLAGVSVVLAH